VEVGHRALVPVSRDAAAAEAAHGLADSLAQLGDFRQAAEASEAFVAAYDRARAGKDGPRIEPRSSTRPPAGWRRHRARRGCTGRRWGRTERAIAAYQAYLKRFPDRKDASDVALSLGRLQESAGRLSAAAQAYEKAETLASAGAAPRRFEALGLQLQAGARRGMRRG
jgi:tetratricopeptide (TPR) repeat protein